MKSCSSSCWLSNFPMNFLTHPITKPLSHYLRLHWGWAAVGYILYFVHGTMHPELLPFQKIRLTRPCFWHASHVPSLGHNPWVPFLIWQPPPPHTHTHLCSYKLERDLRVTCPWRATQKREKKAHCFLDSLAPPTSRSNVLVPFSQSVYCSRLFKEIGQSHEFFLKHVRIFFLSLFLFLGGGRGAVPVTRKN